MSIRAAQQVQHQRELKSMPMSTLPITLQVDTALAQAYEAASPEEKRKVAALARSEVTRAHESPRHFAARGDGRDGAESPSKGTHAGDP